MPGIPFSSPSIENSCDGVVYCRASLRRPHLALHLGRDKGDERRFRIAWWQPHRKTRNRGRSKVKEVTNSCSKATTANAKLFNRLLQCVNLPSLKLLFETSPTHACGNRIRTRDGTRSPSRSTLVGRRELIPHLTGF